MTPLDWAFGLRGLLVDPVMVWLSSVAIAFLAGAAVGRWWR